MQSETKRKILDTFFCAFLCLCFCVSAWGQTPHTQLTGTLVNPDGTGFTGTLYLSIEQAAAISPLSPCGGPTQVVPTQSVTTTITNGTMVSWTITGSTTVHSGAPKIFGSDCTIPLSIPYNAILRDPQGNIKFSTQWLIVGATQDIGTVFQAPAQVPSTALILLVGNGIPSNPCPASTEYMQSDGPAGSNNWSCVNGTWVQQTGTPGSTAIGSVINSGAPNEVLFADASSTLGQDSVFTYNKTTHTMGLANLVLTNPMVGSVTGNSGTTTKLASLGSQCSSPNVATGIDQFGNAACTPPIGGSTDVSITTPFSVTGAIPIADSSHTRLVTQSNFTIDSLNGIITTLPGQGIQLYVPAAPVVVGTLSTGTSVGPNSMVSCGKFTFAIIQTTPFALIGTYDVSKNTPVLLGTPFTTPVTNAFGMACIPKVGATDGSGYLAVGYFSGNELAILNYSGTGVVTSGALATGITNAWLQGDPYDAINQIVWVNQFNSGAMTPVTVTSPLSPSVGTAVPVVISGGSQINTLVAAPGNNIVYVSVGVDAGHNSQARAYSQSGTILGSVNLAHAPQRMLMVGNYTFTAEHDSQEIQIVDFTVPATPVLIKTLNISCAAEEMTTDHIYLYVSGDSGCVVQVNIDNPFSPFIVNSWTISSGSAAALSVSGHYLLGAAGTSLITTDIGGVYTPIERADRAYVRRLFAESLVVKGKADFEINSTVGNFPIAVINTTGAANIPQFDGTVNLQPGLFDGQTLSGIHSLVTNDGSILGLGNATNGTSMQGSQLNNLATGTLSTDAINLGQATLAFAVYTATGTFTTATSDTFTVTGVTSSSRCVFSPTNSTSANMGTVLAYISGVATNAVTLTHAATVASGGTINIFCH